MGGYSGAAELTPKQASSARAPQDRAEASSKPAQQLADAGSSEPPAGQHEGGLGRPTPEDAPAQRGVEPAIHSNSGEQLETERAGSMPGISSKDEVQVRNSCCAVMSTAFHALNGPCAFGNLDGATPWRTFQQTADTLDDGWHAT